MRRVLETLVVFVLAILAVACDQNQCCQMTAPTLMTQPSPTQTPTPQPVICAYELSPISYHFLHQGGTGSVQVTTNRDGCPWTAVPSVSWVKISSSENDTGKVLFSIEENNTPLRRAGKIFIASHEINITQDGEPVTPFIPPCTYAVQESPQDFTYQGGNGGFSVSTSRPDCTWTAVSNTFWVEIKSGWSGTGNGSVNYTVAGNGGVARETTISVAGKSVTIREGAHP